MRRPAWEMKLPETAYSAEADVSAAKAGSYVVFSEREYMELMTVEQRLPEKDVSPLSL